MSYFLPIQSRMRFCAFIDLPEVAGRLNSLLASYESLEWNILLREMADVIVPGTPVRGVLSAGNDGTMITNEVGLPQVDYPSNPPSLLFMMGTYSLVGSSSDTSYSAVLKDWFRWKIDATKLIPNSQSLAGVLAQLAAFDLSKASAVELAALAELVGALGRSITRLETVQDPLSAALPALASESEARSSKDKDLQGQIDAILNQDYNPADRARLTNYYSKGEVDEKLDDYTLEGTAEAMVANRVLQSDFVNHILDNNAHGTDYTDVGAPSVAQHTALTTLVNQLAVRLGTQEAKPIISSLTAAGGMAVNDVGNGVWKVDASYLAQGEPNKPDEIEFFRGNILSVEIGAGRWYAWEPIQLLSIRASVAVPPQGMPIVVDLLKNGVSIYDGETGLRPTIAEGTYTVLAPVPSVHTLALGDYLTMNILQVGSTTQGEDLSIQIRYQYV